MPFVLPSLMTAEEGVQRYRIYPELSQYPGCSCRDNRKSNLRFGLWRRYPSESGIAPFHAWIVNYEEPIKIDRFWLPCELRPGLPKKIASRVLSAGLSLATLARVPTA